MIAARVVVVQSLLGPVAERKLNGRGIRCLCPMYSREVRHARRVEIKSYPLYSRYMFAWAHDEQLREILAVRECVDVLRKIGQPRELAIVPQAVIDALSYEPVLNNLEPGDRVSVRHGKWEGLSGLYSRSEQERVFLLFHMLGKQVEMPFHYSEVSKNL